MAEALIAPGDDEGAWGVTGVLTTQAPQPPQVARDPGAKRDSGAEKSWSDRAVGRDACDAGGVTTPMARSGRRQSSSPFERSRQNGLSAAPITYAIAATGTWREVDPLNERAPALRESGGAEPPVPSVPGSCLARTLRANAR
jgi:hypothetical protein